MIRPLVVATRGLVDLGTVRALRLATDGLLGGLLPFLPPPVLRADVFVPMVIRAEVNA